jgi:ribosomal protein L37AE/L43A
MPLHRERAVDGRMHFLGASLDEYARSGPLAQIAARKGLAIPQTSRVADVDPIPAVLNEDMWIALCPDCRRNAQLVWLDQPLYMCAYCWNVKVGGSWRPVALPSEASRRHIEVITGHRAFAHERNWRGESMAALCRENVDNGAPIPAQETD